MPVARFPAFFALPMAALVASCSLGSDIGSTVDSTLGLGSNSVSAQSSGLAVGDEPFAVKTGTAILNQGGSAADAATAMFFAMAATYPVAAGLGGGGICIVADPAKGVREFDFLPRAARAGGAYAVPGAVRGFYDLQTSFGILPWQRAVSGGETYAAAGFPISHALSARLANAQNAIRLDASLAAEFLGENGNPKPEGTVVSNDALSQSLAAIRLYGADGFYTGAVADQMIRYSASQGGAISAADLSEYRTAITAPRVMTQGGFAVAIPNGATGAGAFVASLFTNAARSSDPEGAVVAGVRQSLASFGIAALPPDLGGTGFAVIDKNGQAVTCAVTMNGAFGAAHSAGNSGILLANTPSAPAGIAGAFLTPLIARDGNGRVALTGAGAGGPNGTAAIAYALLKLASGRELGRPADLRSTGAAPMVTVNVIACQNACVALSDPGGHGLGAATDQ
ncbi:MAG TPA: gamma-glutamyltransferase [Rhizomicrobium sp.]